MQPAEAPSRPPLRRLRRGKGGSVTGLCAGIGEHLGLDPLLVRLVLLLAAFASTGGLAVIAIYFLFSLFVPLAD